MSKDIRNVVVILIFIGITIGGALYYSKYKQTHKRLPYYKVEVGSKEFVFNSMPPENPVGDFNFINQKGEKITQKTIGENIYVADFIFTTCPGICKIMTTEMATVYKAFKDEPRFKILSHTSKPEEDSVSELLKYSIEQGADDASKWLFLTGEKMELQRMAYKEYGLVNPEDLQEKGSFVHTEMVVLVDSKKFIRGYYDGTDSTEMKSLLVDIQSLLNEGE